MNNSYFDLVKQTFKFPQEGFEVTDDYLEFNGLDLKALIKKYGTPMKLSYLPKIGMQIKKAQKMFDNAFKKYKYTGEYNYCYCTKSSHFSFVVEEALKQDIHLETSYAYDIEIIKKLYARKKMYLAMQNAFDGAAVVGATLDGSRKAKALRRTFDRNVQRGPREFSWFIFRVTNPTMREFFMSPANPFRVKEALISLLAGDIYGRTPIWGSIRVLKALYYLVSIGNLRRTVRAWQRRRVNIRDVGATAS